MKILFLILSFCIISSSAYSSTSYLIVHKDNKTEITKELVSKIYLGQMTHWENGDKILPMVNKKNKSELKGFVKTFLNMSTNRYKSYWRTKLFSGNGVPPRNVKTTTKALDITLENTGAIFYSFQPIANDKIKIIEIKN